MLAGRDQHLAAEVPALLLRCQLVLPVHRGGAGGDHLLHQFEGVQRAAEAGLGISHDRHDQLARPITVLPIGPGDLIGPHERVVDPPHHGRHRVDGIEALVGIGVTRQVGIGRNLPARQVDRLQPGFHLLHGLLTSERAERSNVRSLAEQPPQSLGSMLGERVLFDQRSA